MKEILVGIAYEGGTDIDVIEVILRRILREHDLVFGKPNPATPGTAIVAYASTYTRRFKRSNIDLAVYCTDQDVDKKSRRDKIIEKIKAVDPSWMNNSAIGVAEPHLEAWLLSDEDTVKRILKLSPTEPLPHAELKLQPKDRLTSLYQEAEDVNGSLSEIKSQIATEMNLDHVRRQKGDFNYFVQSINKAANFIKQ